MAPTIAMRRQAAYIHRCPNRDIVPSSFSVFGLEKRCSQKTASQRNTQMAMHSHLLLTKMLFPMSDNPMSNHSNMALTSVAICIAKEYAAWTAARSLFAASPCTKSTEAGNASYACSTAHVNIKAGKHRDRTRVVTISNKTPRQVLLTSYSAKLEGVCQHGVISFFPSSNSSCTGLSAKLGRKIGALKINRTRLDQRKGGWAPAIRFSQWFRNTTTNIQACASAISWICKHAAYICATFSEPK
mmetsp:Transcript_18167/g.42231  ORF Transcript_18167/g.42231 Transcript_18167/m.42231 type:complete len:243 (+) Transcript_18167:2956-3684(+)